MKKYKKKQNLGRTHNIIDDIAFAESNGIGMPEKERDAFGIGQIFDEIAIVHDVLRDESNGIKELCGEFRNELPHAVEIGLQAGQENKIVFFTLKGIERTMPVFMVQTDIETLGVNERSDMKAAYRLHNVAGSPLDMPRSKMRANDKRPLFLRAIGR
jgi:hypothetical protein